MIYFLALLPATGLTVAGYVVLYIAGRSEGVFRKAGQVLAIWAFALAALVILGAIFAAAHGGGRARAAWRERAAAMGLGGRYGPFRRFDATPPNGSVSPPRAAGPSATPPAVQAPPARP